MKNFIQKRVVDLFGSGQLYCAETVLTVIAECGGRGAKEYIGLATGFCSGASRTNGQCGAVSGAILGIGLFVGRTKPGGEYEPAYSLVQEFLAQFSEQVDSINCYELTGCDFSTPEGQEQFAEQKVIEKCLEFAVLASEIAVNLLLEHGYIEELEVGDGASR